MIYGMLGTWYGVSPRGGLPMDEKEITSFIAEFESYMASVITSKERARKFLQDAGIYTKKGHLRKEYRSPGPGMDAR